MTPRRSFRSRVGPATKARLLVRIGRLLTGDALLSCIVVTLICLLGSFGGIALTWLYYHDRNNDLGFLEYLTVVVF